MDPRSIPFPPPLPLATIPEQTAIILPPHLHPHLPPPLFVAELRPPTPPPPPNVGAMTVLPLAFFTRTQPGSARFSTCLGRYPKRALPDPLPTKIVRSNEAQDICKKQVALFAEFPLEARNVKAPETWYDLYEYFDAFDLWVEGPDFCLAVLRSMEKEAKEMNDERAVQIDTFARMWVGENEYVLAQYPDAHDIFSMPQFDRSLVENMTPEELMTLKEALNYWRSQFFAYCAEMARANGQYSLRGMPAADFRGMVHPIPAHVPPQMHMQGEAFIDQRGMHRGPTAALVPPTPQNYASFMQTQRESISLRNEHSVSSDSRARAWSNDSNRNGRGGHRGGRCGNYNNRRWVGPPRASPPRQPGTVEPVYHLAGEQQRNDSTNMGSQQGRPHGINDIRQYPQQNQRTASNSSSRRSTIGMNDGRVSSVSLRQGPCNNGKDRVFSSYAASQGTITQNPTSPASPVADEITKRLEATTASETQNSVNNASKILNNNEPQYEKRQHGNGAVTIYYNRGSNAGVAGNMRTVYVRNFDETIFWNHTLMEMMSGVGEVESIQYYPQREAAFVAFKDEKMVERAISALHNTNMGSRGALEVSIPNNRDRSRSYTSQGSFGRYSSYEGNRGFDRRNSNPRRFSFRNQRPNVPFHTQQVSELSELRAAVQEFVHYRSDSNPFEQQVPFQQVPLGNIENLHSNQPISTHFERQLPLGNIENLQQKFVKKQDDEAIGFRGRRIDVDFPYQAKMMNNENSPTKYSQSSRGGGTKNKKKKGSRQNTSTRPTPIATPVKNRSHTGLTEPPEFHPQQSVTKPEDNHKDALDTGNFERHVHTYRTLKENMPLRLVLSGKPESSQNEEKVEVQPKKNKKSKNKTKKGSAKSDAEFPMSMNSSFATDASFSDIISPVGTEFTSFGRVSKTTSHTSFSTLPSRKSSAVLSDTSVPPFTESFQSRRLEFSDTENKEPSDRQVTKLERNNSRDHSMPTETSQTGTDRNAQFQGHSKKHSNSSASSNKSLRKADSSKSKKGENTAAEKMLKSTPDLSPLTTSKGVRNKASTESILTKPLVEPPQQLNMTSQVDVADNSEFPALKPSDCHVSNIAGGKRPAPVPASATASTLVSEPIADKKKGRPIPIVAVPRNFKPRTQPIALNHQDNPDEFLRLGSETWPFIKTFRAL